VNQLVKCEGTACLRKESCARFTQTPLIRYQAWLCMSVSVKVVGECKFHISNEEKGNGSQD
jgi:hypothetical protein